MSFYLGLIPPNPPGLDKFPVNIHGMIPVQQQPFAPIQKSQPKKVVINKRRHGVQNAFQINHGQRLARASFA